MPDFLELLETYQAADASTATLYAGDGTSIRGTRRDNPRYVQALAEAATLIANVTTGRTPSYRLQEAMTTSDFPLLFGDILDRQLLAAYTDWPVQWTAIARQATTRDFRTVKRFAVDGGGATLDPVAQNTEYPAASMSDKAYSYAVQKYGRKLPFSWESFINDDLGGLRDAPTVLARAARRSEEKFAVQLFTGASGPLASFFSAGNKNIVTGNPVLSMSALQSAMTVLSSQVDPDGNPIYVEAVTLVVPPALEVVANNIIHATEIRGAAGSGAASATSDQLVAINWMKNRVNVQVNPWLPIVASTANGSTAWYLIANPGAGRPVMEVGRLRGHEAPEVFMKTPNATRLGGGMVGAEEGDFDTDSIEYKVRHVFGGSLLDPKGAVASNGSGV